MKRALFVSYYFPPLGGVGALRPLKFSKYLPQFGWNVDVLTVDPAIGLKLDSSLAQDVPEGTRIQAAASAEIHIKALDRVPLAKYWRLLLWPDSAVLWKNHAIRLGKKMAQEQRYDLIFSSAPPYSAHLVAATLSRELALPWIADYRDPWSQNPMLHRVQPWRQGLDRWAERRILRQADHVIVTTQSQQTGLISDFATPEARVTVIPNGFDRADFPVAAPPQNEVPILVYTGSAYGDYHPLDLLDGLNHFATQHPERRFKVKLIGAVSAWMRAHAPNRQYAFDVELVDFIPHGEIPSELQQADGLLLVWPERLRANIPAKLFEYLATGRPIFALLPRGCETEKVLQESQCGMVVHDTASVAPAFEEFYRAWERRAPMGEGHADRVRQFDRQHQSKALAALFDQVVTAREGTR